MHEVVGDRGKIKYDTQTALGYKDRPPRQQAAEMALTDRSLDWFRIIERANVSVTELSLRVLQLVLRVRPAELVTLIDTLVPRCVKFGPGISIKHDHSHKANRPTFLNSQCWVTLALVVRVRAWFWRPRPTSRHHRWWRSTPSAGGSSPCFTT